MAARESGPDGSELSERLGPTRETVVRIARAAGVNGDPAGPGDDGIDTWYGNQYLPCGALAKLVALAMAEERARCLYWRSLGDNDGYTTHHIEAGTPLPVGPNTTAPTGVVSSTALGDEKCECEVCCGKGWNWEEHQVAERKSDVQTLKIQCDKCEGTGYELHKP